MNLILCVCVELDAYLFLTYLEFYRHKNSDLIIIDEVSMLTTQIAYKVDFTLRYLMSGDDIFENLKNIQPFGGKNILFVGDFLQLPPVLPNNSSSVSQKLITQCS